ALEGTEQLILVGSRTPVAFFAYPGKPSVLTPEGCDIITLANPSDDLPQALEQLAEAAGATDTAVVLAPRGDLVLPNGDFSARAIIQALGALCPDNAIICDESVSSGRESFKWTWNSAPHDFLQIT